MKSAGPGRGHFETMETFAECWELSGWICHPDVASVVIVHSVDGVEIGRQQPTRREDVAATFGWIPHAGDSGFRLQVPRRPGRQSVRVEARDASGLLTVLRTTVHSEFADLPHPPAALMQRVSGSPDPRFFDADGVRSYSEFFATVAEFRDWATIPRMLDWGCGCGRVTRCFLRAHPDLEVHGCDIDAEAIAWCDANLAPGRFRAIAPQPPTTYPDGYFSLAIGYSVFSHLNPDLQRAWLEEMRRIVAPGGLFLASVHGPFAARFAFPSAEPESARWRWRKRRSAVDVRSAGFVDAGEDLALTGVAPAGYYRGTFQSPEWTKREWSRYFRVLDVREGGMQNYQDLVILERK